MNEIQKFSEYVILRNNGWIFPMWDEKHFFFCVYPDEESTPSIRLAVPTEVGGAMIA